MPRVDIARLIAMVQDTFPAAFPGQSAMPRTHITPINQLTDQQVFDITDANNRRMRGW